MKDNARKVTMHVLIFTDNLSSWNTAGEKIPNTVGISVFAF